MRRPKPGAAGTALRTGRSADAAPVQHDASIRRRADADRSDLRHRRDHVPVDSQIRIFLDEVAKFPPLHTLGVDAARGMTIPPAPGVEVERVEDLLVRSPEGHDIPVRFYRPRRASSLPMLVFFHGGGWVLGTLDSHDSLCRLLAVLGVCAVFSVDFRLAPEHKFPPAPEDSLA